MKTIVRMALLLCLPAVPAAQLLAQTVYYSNDVRNTMANGLATVRNIDTLTRSVDIGKPGQTANAWRFDSLATSATLNLTGKAPAGTPYAAEFSAATTALQMQGSVSITYAGFPLPITLQNVYFYGGISDNAYQDMGFRATSPLAPDAILRWKYTPGDTAFVFPVTFGAKWTSTFKETLYVFGTTILGVINLTTARSHIDTSTADAFGTFRLPGSATTHDALRIRTVDHITTYNSGGAPSFSTAVYYTFVSRDGARVKLTAKDTTQPDNGRILITLNHDFVHDIQWNTSNVTTDVPLAAAVPSEYALQQNYPNPFNPSTTVRYSVPERSRVTLTVYNLLGQQVAQLVSGDRDRGTYEVRFDASALPSGTYFYRLTAGSFVETRRMMLVK